MDNFNYKPSHTSYGSDCGNDRQFFFAYLSTSQLRTWKRNPTPLQDSTCRIRWIYNIEIQNRFSILQSFFGRTVPLYHCTKRRRRRWYSV